MVFDFQNMNTRLLWKSKQHIQVGQHLDTNIQMSIQDHFKFLSGLVISTFLEKTDWITCQLVGGV